MYTQAVRHSPYLGEEVRRCHLRHVHGAVPHGHLLRPGDAQLLGRREDVGVRVCQLALLGLSGGARGEWGPAGSEG
jgi:hypothetical protein